MGTFIRATLLGCHGSSCSKSPHWEQFFQRLPLYGSVTNAWASSLAGHLPQLLILGRPCWVTTKICIVFDCSFTCGQEKAWITGLNYQVRNQDCGRLSEIKHLCVVGSGHTMLPFPPAALPTEDRTVSVTVSCVPRMTSVPFTSPLEMSLKTGGPQEITSKCLQFFSGSL